MGRSAGDARGGVKQSQGFWDEVRRALGRLVAHTPVHGLPPDRLAPQAAIPARQEDLLRPEPVRRAPGPRSSEWQPVAHVVALPPLRGEPGGGGIDLAALFSPVSANGVLRPESSRICLVPVQTGGSVVRSLPSAPGPAGLPAVRTVSVRPASGGVVAAAAVLPSVPVRALSAARLGEGRVRSGLPFLERVPLVRSRRPLPPGQKLDDVYVAERRRLARAVNEPVGEISLLGVYGDVPVTAIRRLSLEDDGAWIELWLKPEALRKASYGPRVTLVVGRLGTTGRIVQTVMI